MKLLIFLAVLAVVGYLVYAYVVHEKTLLSIQYGVPESKIIMDPKPHGCAYDDAPLGNKYCHYEKQVDAARACSECPVTAVYVSWRKVEGE